MGTSSVSMVSLAASVESPAIGSNPRRKKLTFFLSVATSVAYLRPDAKGNVVDGLPILGNSGPIEMTVEDYGDIVKGPWFAFSAFVGNLGIIESVE